MVEVERGGWIRTSLSAPIRVIRGGWTTFSSRCYRSIRTFFSDENFLRLCSVTISSVLNPS